MAVKYATVENGLYTGGISSTEIENILAIRNSEIVEGLKQKIFNFPEELIIRSLDEGRSIRDIIKSENIVYKDYIGKLRDYQTTGTAFMYLSARSILADGVGLGKTAEIAALINLLKVKKEITRFLIAVETSALEQTQIELIRFTGLNVVILPSEAPKMKKVIKNTDWSKVDGIVIKHSALRSSILSGWIALHIENDKCTLFNTFFLDESSVIKNDTSKIYKYTKNICDLMDRIHLMNATTFETSIMDIYYQVDMMNPNILPKKWRIEDMFCVKGSKTYWTTKKNEHGVNEAQMNRKWNTTGYKNQEIFKKSLSLFYFGRCKADIGMEMPHVYKVYKIDPTLDQLAALSQKYRYMEVLNSPENIPEINIKMTRENVPKLDRLCSLIETEFNDCQSMVYCFHINAQYAIKRELEAIGKKCCILNGEDVSADKDEKRAKLIKDFNAGVYDVIITNIKKSLNLNAADVCFMYSLEVNPARMEQIRGRIDRNVDDRIKTFVLLLYAHTDEYSYFMSVVKKRASDARDLTIDAKGAVDFFIESMEEENG